LRSLYKKVRSAWGLCDELLPQHPESPTQKKYGFPKKNGNWPSLVTPGFFLVADPFHGAMGSFRLFSSYNLVHKKNILVLW